jgi:DDE family transposase
VAQQQLQEKDIVGLGYLKRIFPLLEKLHEVGCQRDKAGNRDLHFDQYCKLILLYIWNPILASIGGLQRAVGLDHVAKAVGVKRFSKGSFSESVRVFEPELLKPIIAELAGELTSGPMDPRLKDFKHVLTLVDGTVLRGLVSLAKAADKPVSKPASKSDGKGRGKSKVGSKSSVKNKGEPPPTRYNTLRNGRGVYGWRLHTQLDLKTFCPSRIDRTGARNAGDARESNVLRRALQACRCYVGDGGYNDRTLFDDIHKIGSCYVIRAAENSVFEVIEERLLSQAALDAGIVRDALIRIENNPHPMRCVEVAVKPHPRRQRGGMRTSDRLILYTDLVDPIDLPPELIGLIYNCRYAVELFFRVFKQLLGARHLLSNREEGLDIQVYCTVLACILIQLISGKKPNIAMRSMLGWYLLGVATEAEVIAFLNKPDNTGIKLRAKEELWKKMGF